MRGERDRFVAFAFCSADILLELDSRHVITYAGGATVALTGRPAGGLVGTSVYDLLPPREQPLLRRLLERAATGARQEGVGLHVLGSSGHSFPLAVGGYYLPDLGGHYFLALRMQENRTPATALEAAARDLETGLLGSAAFSDTGAARLREALSRGEQATFTVLDLNGLTDLRDRLNAESQRELMSTLGQVLRESSLGGDLAGALGADYYGLLHQSGFDVKELETRIDGLALSVDPEHQGIEVSAAAVEMGASGFDGVDAARAFVHAVKNFEKCEGDNLSIENMTKGLSQQMEDTVRRIGNTRSVITARAFDVAFQPIIDLESRRVHHFEALMRLRDTELSPFQFVSFAEQVGMVCDFDIAMCRRVIAWLEQAHKVGQDYVVAVNLSGRSLASLEFVADLLNLLKNNDWIGNRLMFELTESANIADLNQTNAIIQRLRKSGFRVCLDDFGAGESAFHYLRALDVDMVKIDGSYVRHALAETKDRHFLKSIANLCHDLKIATIAEMIEQEKTIKLLQSCGVRYGQGYLFGRPSLDITSFDARRSAGPPAQVALGGQR
ncbi:MAG TPA: sensor domain-containing phosphodiesterase [Alphaproteobacteria bacterium]|nr:sensor domain-containing phosphodiesterase [Alphaproteobacteria bacterium]